MRIVIHGQQAFGKSILERLLAGPDAIVGVSCPPDRDTGPMDPLKELALEKGLPVQQPKSWKTEEAAELMRSFAADLCVMAYVTLIVPKRVLDTPKFGTIQYHPSLLPLHRGPSSINWPIIRGESTTGLTIFWPDEHVDTGPILLQKEVEIGPDDTLGSVYFDKLFPLGVDAMMEAIDLVREGKAPRIEQDESRATYESWCGEPDAEIDWSKRAHEIHCLIRGTDPQPGAWTTLGGNKLKVYGSKILDGFGVPGEILSISDAGMLVAAGDRGIRITRVRPHDGRSKIPAQEYANNQGINPGTRLGVEA
jgi:methionyl-tRNA formyltransferase